MQTAFSPKASRYLSIIPSIIDALPKIEPERIESGVFVPITETFPPAEMSCKSAVELESALSETFTPGIIEPPKNAPFLSMAEIVVAVPKSNIIIGGAYFANAPTAPQTRSAPNIVGSSRRMLSPVLMPGPTTNARIPVKRSMASFRTGMSEGTTLEIIAPLNPVLSIS